MVRAPRLGRWLSNDPIGISGGLNLYEFCGSDPVNWRDPWGEDIYFDSGSGGHADLIIDNPKSPTGKTWFSFAPKEGGWNDLTLNLIGGPSKTTLKDWPTDVPTTAFRIPTTYEQDEAALCTAKEAQNDNFPYSAIPWINNCAHMTRTILRGAGLPFDNKFWDTPARLERDVRNYLQNK